MNGNADSSADTSTLEPLPTANSMSAATSRSRVVVAITTTSAPPRKASSRCWRPNGPRTSKRGFAPSNPATAVPSWPAP